jgi:hypothetical protein
MSKIGMRYDWRLVRGIGQLHLLNRASMMILVLVPMCAAVWPTIRFMLESTFARTALLPESWAYLFAASLATIVGRTIFQLGCPEVLVGQSLVEYVRTKKREYAEAPSASAVSQAVDHLRTIGIDTELIVEELEEDRQNASERQDLRSRIEAKEREIEQHKLAQAPFIRVGDWESSQLAKLRDHVNELRDLRDGLRRVEDRDRGDRGPSFRRRMALVELSAESSYLRAARTSRIALSFCTAAYLTAIALILLVIVHQSHSIAVAAGWLG